MKESVLKEDRKGVCFLCKKHMATEKHHIFGAANRKKSDEIGLFVHLCHYCHNEPPNGVHFNAKANYNLRKIGQKAAMMHYGWSIEDFRLIFGKNYL